MPYELSFTKQVQITDPDLYFNECCIGGDIVLDALLPGLNAAYGDEHDSGQEDWGWFAWFQGDYGVLEVNITTDDPAAGAFRIHLVSSIKGRFFGYKDVDTEELERLKPLVEKALLDWTGVQPGVEHHTLPYA